MAKPLVKSYIDIKEMEMEGGARIRWLITHKDGAENYSMRYIRIDENKETPAHKHPYEHEIFVMSGTGYVVLDNENVKLKPYDFIFIPGNVFHKIHSNTTMEIICVVPISAAKELLGD
ncbi:MAG: cupin domain-containing protein [Thermoplasmata archaeon]